MLSVYWEPVATSSSLKGWSPRSYPAGIILLGHHRMRQWSGQRKLIAGLAGAAMYFAAAIYLKASYVPMPKPPGGATGLQGRFERFGGSAFAYVARVPFEELADSDTDSSRSPIILFENDRALGPAHSSHADIGAIGRGRFSHWKGIGVVFSTSDNSNPNFNGRRYSIVQP